MLVSCFLKMCFLTKSCGISAWLLSVVFSYSYGYHCVARHKNRHSDWSIRTLSVYGLVGLQKYLLKMWRKIGNIYNQILLVWVYKLTDNKFFCLWFDSEWEMQTLKCLCHDITLCSCCHDTVLSQFCATVFMTSWSDDNVTNQTNH